MGDIKSVGDLNTNVEDGVHRERTPGDAVLECFAFEQLHHKKCFPFKFLNVVNRADVGMIQGGGGAGFAAEALEGLRILAQLLREEFEGDAAAQLEVFGGVDDAHAAATELFKNAVVSEGLAGHWLDCRCAK